MNRNHWIAVMLLVFSSSALAGDLERDVRSHWLGAWVVVDVESYSDCGGMYTNNRVNGTLVKGKGARAFEPGELAKVDKVDVKRSRVDVLVSLSEPLLVPYSEGPFTLYREARCKLEFEVEISREVVKAKDDQAINVAILAVFERHSNRSEAERSESWNEREIEPYPADYALTLARVEIWKAEQTNQQVREKLDLAQEQTTRLGDRVSSDSGYLEGFARGVEAARANPAATCDSLLKIKIGDTRPRSRESQSGAETVEQRSERGFADGKTLVYGLDMMRRLPGCFVPVPALPEIEVAAQ